jgi:hypothetical protein
MWRFSDGTLLPVVRGGSDDGGAGSGDAGSGDGGSGDAGDGGSGSGDAGDGGSGSGDAGSGDAGSGDDAAKWKALSRKHEAEAKKAKAELDKIRAANQTEAEKALEAARQEGRQAATVDVAQRLAAAEIKAALTGIVPDPASIVEDLNLAKYVDDSGEVNSEAVAELRKRFEGLSKGARRPGGGNPLGQGQKGEPARQGQLTQADLSKMSPQEIVKARREGRLADLQRGIGLTTSYAG